MIFYDRLRERLFGEQWRYKGDVEILCRVDQLKQQLAEKQEECDRWKDSNDSNWDACVELDQKNKKLQAEVDELTAELDSKRTLFKSMCDKQRSDKEKIDEIGHQLDSWKRTYELDISVFKQQIKERDELIKEARQWVEHLISGKAAVFDLSKIEQWLEKTKYLEGDN